MAYKNPAEKGQNSSKGNDSRKGRIPILSRVRMLKSTSRRTRTAITRKKRIRKAYAAVIC